MVKGQNESSRHKELDKYIQEIAKTRKIGIFGMGKVSEQAEQYLEQLGIEQYSFFDNELSDIVVFHNKRAYPPQYIDKHFFILNANGFFLDISKQLNKMGMVELDDYVNVAELDYYNTFLKYPNAPKVPNIGVETFAEINSQLEKYVNIVDVDWIDRYEFEKFEKNLGFEDIYDKERNARYERKIMEYYLASKVLNFDSWNSQKVYLDVGAASSPFAKYLREKKGINAYALDLCKGAYSELDYYLTEDATDMSFEDGTVDAISMQSAFEMFLGDSDTRFIVEASRVLKKGGKVVILPLYMNSSFLSTVSPNYYKSGTADEGALECIRTDCRSYPLGRFYDAHALYERVIKTAEQCGMDAKVYILPNEFVCQDKFVYLKYLLCLEK